MPVVFISDYVTLSANGEDTIKLKYDTAFRFRKILAYGTGAFQITKIEIEGQRPFLAGTLHSEQLKERGNTIELPEDIHVPANKEIIFYVKDISGAENTVYIGVIAQYG